MSIRDRNVYTIGFIDAATKRAWLYQRKRKSDIWECIKDFYENVIVKKSDSQGLKDFAIQSDDGECKSDAVCKCLSSVGGELR